MFLICIKVHQDAELQPVEVVTGTIRYGGDELPQISVSASTDAERKAEHHDLQLQPERCRSGQDRHRRHAQETRRRPNFDRAGHEQPQYV